VTKATDDAFSGRSGTPKGHFWSRSHAGYVLVREGADGGSRYVARMAHMGGGAWLGTFGLGGRRRVERRGRRKEIMAFLEALAGAAPQGPKAA